LLRSMNSAQHIPKLKPELIHLLFKIGVAIKGIDGALEAVAGFALFFTSRAALRDLVDWLTAGEMREDPTDFVATHLIGFFHHLSKGTENFASVYLLIYGLAKVGLAVGLLRGKLWAYPAALAALGLFLCYQFYRVVHTHSLGLGLLSLVDLAILAVIWRDYKFVKARGGHFSLANESKKVQG
jgi:uncharacterized membrane protein